MTNKNNQGNDLWSCVYFDFRYDKIKSSEIRRPPFNIIVMKYEHVIKSLLRQISIGKHNNE